MLPIDGRLTSFAGGRSSLTLGPKGRGSAAAVREAALEAKHRVRAERRGLPPEGRPSLARAEGHGYAVDGGSFHSPKAALASLAPNGIRAILLRAVRRGRPRSGLPASMSEPAFRRRRPSMRSIAFPRRRRGRPRSGPRRKASPSGPKARPIVPENVRDHPSRRRVPTPCRTPFRDSRDSRRASRWHWQDVRFAGRDGA
jgi:hypothetical protein